jgi:beta-lactamase regulating signal transducer with metallopeptidase domain
MRLASYIAEVLGWTAIALAWQPVCLSLVCGYWMKRYRASPQIRYRVLVTAVYSLPAALVLGALATHLSLVGNASQGPRGALGVHASQLTDLLASSFNRANILLWAGCIWLAGALRHVVRMLTSHWHTKRLRTSATGAPLWLKAKVREHARAMGVHRVPQVIIHHAITVPFVTGGSRSVLAFPIRNNDEGDADALILHELAHLRREDHVTNLIIQLIVAAFWYHPALLLLARQVCDAREECCDDEAVQHLASPLPLARALVRLAEVNSRPMTLMGAASGSLRSRVLRLTSRCCPSQSVEVWWKPLIPIAATTGIVAFAILASWKIAPACDRLAIDGAFSGALAANRTLIHGADPAGDFTLALMNGRVAEATISRIRVDSRHLRVGQGKIIVTNEQGAQLLAVDFDPMGAIRWEPRTALRR